MAAAARQAGAGLRGGAVVERGDRAFQLEADAGRGGGGAERGQHVGGQGRRRRWRAFAGGEDLEAVAAGAPEAGGGAAGEVAQVAAAEERQRAAEAAGQAGQRLGGGGGEEDGVRVGADLDQGAVEVEEKRVVGGEPQAVEVAERHAATR